MEKKKLIRCYQGRAQWEKGKGNGRERELENGIEGVLAAIDIGVASGVKGVFSQF